MAKKAKQSDAEKGELLVCRNPKASQQFDIEERLEVGIVLTGSEVKSLRARRGDLEGAYASIHAEELFLHKMHIAPYEQAGPFNHEPKRLRKLLAKKHEILRLSGKLSVRGYSLVPLVVYFRNGHCKIELGLGKGRKTGDKRHALRREADLKEARAAMARTAR